MPTHEAKAPPPAPPRWYYRPWAVLVLLFLVLGPVGLPLLWRSPSFSRNWKIVLSAAMAVYTVLLIDSTVVAVNLAMQRLGLG
jgi:hypothetical protein